ncbi:MAG: hypothetical protein JKY56_21695 [Kofleriaceae bacterium]|nr:hypothetical protein [Kofleriaceae bacterium]
MTDKKDIGDTTLIASSVSFSNTHIESQIEVVLVHVNSDSIVGEQSPEQTWRALEFWTANTMYGLDSSLRCIEVNNRDPRGPVTRSHLIGARLVGSQRREDEAFTVSFPYPIPGMEAVFESGKGGQFATTSIVERVMLRVRMTTLETADGNGPDWQQITQPE